MDDQTGQPQEQTGKKPKIILDKITVLGAGVLIIFALAVVSGLSSHPSHQVAVQGESTSVFPTASPTLIPTDIPTLTPPLTPTTVITSTHATIQTAQPTAQEQELSNNNYYINSSGNEVHSPAYSNDGSVPAGATAKCNDGTYSFSQHQSGTCSHHGGVAKWL